MRTPLTNLAPARILGIGLLIPALMVLVAACMPITAPAATSAPAGQVTSTMTNTMTTTTTTSLPAEILGVLWQWQNPAIADPAKYTLQFMAEGQLLVQADCNRGSGPYTLVSQRLFIANIALTRMACPSDSLDQTFLEQVGSVDGYRLEGEKLVLTVRVAPGTMTFTPAAATTQPSGVLTGTVLYRQRVALPTGSVINVQLQDVSKQDVAATVVASQTMTTTGENVPIPFTLMYDPAQITEKSTYALSVRIIIDGQLAWLNTSRYAVLTRGAPKSAIEVVVQSAR